MYEIAFKMKHIAQVVVLFCLFAHYGHSAKLSGPLVYVVTPSSNPSPSGTGRASPFYYRNCIRRMDKPDSIVPSSTTTAKTPDLIFAEFESGHNNLKSIRKLLEKEKFQSTTTTTNTFSPIYVPEEVASTSDSNLPQMTSEQPAPVDMTDYFALYNNLHNSGEMYVPSAPSPVIPSTSTVAPVTTTTTEVLPNNVENIWHIIDNHKHEQFAGEREEATSNESPSEDTQETEAEKWSEHETGAGEGVDENFALPGFGTNPGNGAENESRAIRTEPNIRFPYVNLKPFTMKNVNSKKANNLFSLDNLTEIKHPIRGEVHDTPVTPIRQPIDRYNPAQPYLPRYGTKSKQSSGVSAPAPPASPPQAPKAVFANLVPPPPPAAPQVTADDFPTPSTYESFPPYAPGGSGGAPSFSFPPSPASGPDSSIDYGDDSPPGYKYKAPPSVIQTPVPSPTVSPALPFMPTLPPLMKPFSGYSYDKPPMSPEDTGPTMDMNTKPDFQGYHYNKPAPSSSPSQPPSMPVQDYAPPSYEHHDAAPTSYHSEPDYPELVFDKPHDAGDMKGGDAGKDANDMGMMPPPLADTKPDTMGSIPDHGFPHDFPGGFTYGHDFDDHDYHHHHHHPTTTTTTTTEQPRVNRYSYYYLGKKLYYLPLYFSVYFIVYVGALIIKAILRHKITYPNSFRPNDKTASFFSKRSVESHLSNDNLHEMTSRVTNAIAAAAEKYINDKSKES